MGANDVENDRGGPERAHKALKRIVEGVAAVGVLLSATAVINLIKHVFSLPLAKALAVILKAYTDLMYPIADALFGWIPHLVGLELTPTAKDILVLYCVMASTVARGMAAMYRNYALNMLADWEGVLQFLYNFFFWPLALAQLIRGTRKKLLARPKPKNASPEELMMWQLWRAAIFAQMEMMKAIKKEFLFTLAIVVCALVASSAGVLK